MKFITIVAILGFSSHANAAIPAASTADIGDEKIDQRPLLRGSGMPEFFKDILHHLPTEIDVDEDSFESGNKMFNPTKAAKSLTESAHDLNMLATGYAKLVKLGTIVENVEFALEEKKKVTTTLKNTVIKLEREVAGALKDVLKTELIAIGGDTMYEDDDEEFVSEPMDLSFLDELIAKYEAKIPDNVDIEEVLASGIVGGALSTAASTTAAALDTAAQATANAASVASTATASAMGTATAATEAALDTAVTATGAAMSTAVGVTSAALKL
jgi:hypothetical protein